VEDPELTLPSRRALRRGGPSTKHISEIGFSLGKESPLKAILILSGLFGEGEDLGIV